MRRMDIVTRRLFVAGLLVANVSTYADVVGYWRFEEGIGDSTSDETGQYLGDLIGFYDYGPGVGDTEHAQGWSANVFAATVPQSGTANTGSIRMQGGGAYVDLSNGQDMNLGTSFTVEFYMNPEQPVVASSIFGFSPISELYFFLGEDNSELVFGTSFQGEIGDVVPATMIQTGQWQHVALVKQPSEYSIYVDGSLQYSAPLSPALDGPYWFPGTGNSGDRVIGGESGTFRGYLDEFRISDTALTPDQFLIVPEPSTISLLLVGVAGMLWRRKQRG